jgi:hypothetical protein
LEEVVKVAIAHGRHYQAEAIIGFDVEEHRGDVMVL